MLELVRRSIIPLLVGCLFIFAGLTLFKIEIGPFTFFCYQLPGLLLLRFIPAWRLLLFVFVPLLCFLYWLKTTLPPGLYIELATFSALLLVLDLLADTGKAEHRLLIGLCTILLICFPLYAFALSLFRAEGFVYSAANAAMFVIPTALSLVLVEGLWSLGLIVFGKRFPLFARHETGERHSIVSYTTLAVTGLVATTFSIFIVIWANRWAEIIVETAQLRADQFANSQLMANLHEVDVSFERFLGASDASDGNWIQADSRFIFMRLPKLNAEGLVGSVVENPLPGSAWHEQAFVALGGQAKKFIYRANMNDGFNHQMSPLYLEINEVNYPVYVFDRGGEAMFFLIDSKSGTVTNEMGRASGMETSLARVGDYPLSVSNKGGDSRNISIPWLGGILSVEASDRSPVTTFGALTENAKFAVLISDELKGQYPLELPFDITLMVQSDIWPHLQVMLRATIVMSVFLVCALILSAGSALLIASWFVKPIKRLLDPFSISIEATSASAFAMTAFLKKSETQQLISSEIYSLHEHLRAYALEADRSNQRLQRSVSSYEKLLGAMPIGVMEIDDNYQLCFRNEAMAEITGDSAEAAYRLRIKAEQLFEASQWDAEYSLPLLNESPRQLSLLLLPRLDDAGSAAGFWMLVTDLTKQKAMDAQLLQSAKLATLGEMSTGMAHELNQPLNIIKLAVSNVKNSINKGRLTEESMISRLERIDSAVGRAATIIDHMRAFGRVAGEGVAPFTIVSAVNAAADLVREPMAAKGVDLINQIQEPVWVQGNTIQFEQVLINMVNNARDAILDASASGAVTLRQTLEDGFVTVMIEDTGGGIPPEVVPHVFEPFYTTKPVGKGTGLGGSISYGIVQDMQGTIWAENVGEGARISIRLPIYSKEKETVAEMGQ